MLIAFAVVSIPNAVVEEKETGRAMGMKSKHAQEAKANDVRFSDVKGINVAKVELEEIVEHLKRPDKFTRLDGKLP